MRSVLPTCSGVAQRRGLMRLPTGEVVLVGVFANGDDGERGKVMATEDADVCLCLGAAQSLG